MQLKQKAILIWCLYCKGEKVVCSKCGKEKVWHGFERRLITRGKNKGMYISIEYYSCECALKDIKK